MHAAALRLELKIPDVQSLKGKRRVLKAFMARIEDGFPVSIAEVGHQDKWQRATVGVAVVAADHGHLQKVIDAVHRRALDWPEIQLIELGIAYLKEDS